MNLFKIITLAFGIIGVLIGFLISNIPLIVIGIILFVISFKLDTQKKTTPTTTSVSNADIATLKDTHIAGLDYYEAQELINACKNERIENDDYNQHYESTLLF